MRSLKNKMSWSVRTVAFVKKVAPGRLSLWLMLLLCQIVDGSEVRLVGFWLQLICPKCSLSVLVWEAQSFSIA